MKEPLCANVAPLKFTSRLNVLLKSAFSLNVAPTKSASRLNVAMLKSALCSNVAAIKNASPVNVVRRKEVSRENPELVKLASSFPLMLYNSVWGPGDDGMTLAPVGGYLIVKEVQPDKPAGRAGMRAGDRILNVGILPPLCVSASFQPP